MPICFADGLVPVAVALPEEAPLVEVKIEIHRDQAMFQISWPASESASCVQWLRGKRSINRSVSNTCELG